MADEQAPGRTPTGAPTGGATAGAPLTGADAAPTGGHDSPGQDAAAEPAQGVAARQAAATALVQVHAQDAWGSPVVDRVLARSGMDVRDRAFAANLAFSALRWEGTLDWVLSHRISRGLDAVEAELLDVLRLGTWELLHGSAPSHAVVHAWVDVARRLVGQRATGFVNGVLRGVDRGRDDLPWPPGDGDDALALRLGYPAWVVGAARRRFGDDRLAAVLESGNTPAPLVLRAVAPREEVLAELAAQGVEAAPGALSRDAVVLASRHVPTDLVPVREGRAIVQDQASQAVGLAAAAGIPAGATAVDLCAAPGGKATHLAQQGLRVTAVDRHAGRLRRAADLAARLGLEVDVLAADGTATGLPEASADLVLVDAPCSGLGVVRRRPELRWRRAPEDVPALAAVQRDLLAAAARLARPGGRVAYAVCTWTEEETDAVVRWALQEGAVEPDDAPAVGLPTAHGVQIAPDLHDGDGMYLALLRVPGGPPGPGGGG